MAVYVDNLRRTIPSSKWPWPNACHLFGDSLEELVEFAGRLGLPEWHLRKRPDFPHFDLTAGRRQKAIELGARSVSEQFAVERTRRNRIETRLGRPGMHEGTTPGAPRGPWSAVPVAPTYGGHPVRIVEFLTAARVAVIRDDGFRQVVEVADLAWQWIVEEPVES